MLDIKVVAKQVYEIAKDHGFHNDENFDDPMEKMRLLAMFVSNLHGEVSELWEACRKGQLDVPCDKAAKMDEPLTCAEEELADIVIRAFDTAETLGIDIERAILIKSKYNESRPYMHGKLA